MKFSYEWLKNLARTKLSPKKTSSLLELHTLETDVEKLHAFEGIFVAKILNYIKHPNADRLRVVDLDLGKDKVISQVVCGASNFKTGDVVALALPGAEIPHNQHDPQGKPFTLDKATIRGIESQGMICSGKELGLSEDGSGILVLKNSTEFIGQTLNSKMT